MRHAGYDAETIVDYSHGDFGPINNFLLDGLHLAGVIEVDVGDPDPADDASVLVGVELCGCDEGHGDAPAPEAEAIRLAILSDPTLIETGLVIREEDL